MLADAITEKLKHAKYDESRRAEYVRFKLAPLSWRAQDGREMYPSQMEDSHLWNTIQMIRDGRMAKVGRHVHKGKLTAWWARMFENELLHRAYTEE